MYFQRQNSRYSFIYYDTTLKKNVRLKVHESPNFTSDTEAAEFCRSFDSKQDALKSRILRKLEWKNKFSNFEVLITHFHKMRVIDAPNSFEMDGYYLNYYILPFFLNEIAQNNVHIWADYFEEFKEFLMTTKPLKTKKKGKKLLAYSTRNNIIKTLNAFLKIYAKKTKSEPKKCEYFAQSHYSIKGEEALIDETAARLLEEKLREDNPEAADFFHLSLKTGARISEMLGLSLADFYQHSTSHPNQNFISQAMKALPADQKIYGYWFLNSQIDHRSQLFKRKPLKGKRHIDFQSSRIIPILDKKAYNIIAERWNTQQEVFKKRVKGSDPSGYLLFPRLNRNTYSGLFRRIQEELKFKRCFTPHDCRHSYSTWLAGISNGNYHLCRLILGHSRYDTTLRYIHLNGQIIKGADLKSQLLQPLEFA